MELYDRIFKLLWIAIKTLLTSKWFYVTLVLAILMKIFYPKFRGFMGEFWVKEELRKLNKNEYTILNNIMISVENATHQIDHIILSKYGIFVIEMKNYYGLIKGEDNQDKWIQYLGKNKYYFKNPIHQNYGHIKSLEKLLNVGNKELIGIVCFSNQAKLKIKTKNLVVDLDNLLNIISNYKTEIIDNESLAKYKTIIQNNNIEDNKVRKNHVKKIKTKIKNDDYKISNMICPKCGNPLVERNGKYGKFLGCTKYPKCNFTKKI